MDGVVDAALLIDFALFLRQCVRHEDNIDVGTFLAQIGNGGNVFIEDITLIEQ